MASCQLWLTASIGSDMPSNALTHSGLKGTSRLIYKLFGKGGVFSVHIGLQFSYFWCPVLRGNLKLHTVPLNFVYRGRHCPLCTKYLNELEQHIQTLYDAGVDIIAVSGDSKEQLVDHLEKLNVSFPMAYGLTEEQMRELGLYISIPRSEKETNHNFSEPGLFVINQDGNIQVVDISNNPFVRPSLTELVSGINWIRNPENHYPIRGTFQ